MEQTLSNETKEPIKKPKINTTPIRVLKTTAKNLTNLIQKLNKKNFGRKVRFDDLIQKAVSLLNEDHLEEIKNSTISNADRLEMNYRDYCRLNGTISKDEFIGQLIRKNGALLAPSVENPSLDS